MARGVARFAMKQSSIHSDDICESICATLRAAIFEGELRPGHKLAEETIARHFRTSRTVVRGALSMLAQQNLAERRRNHGTFVATPGEGEARDLLATRRILEIAVMEALNGRVGPKEIDRLARAIAREKQVHANHDRVAKKRIAGDFHYQLAEFAGNAVLNRMLENILARLSLVNALYERPSACSCGTAHHEAILSHLKRGDIAGARGAMALHLDDMEGGIAFQPAMTEEDGFLAILERMSVKAS